MFRLSSLAGLDTLLFSRCFSKERLFITADPRGGGNLFLSLLLLPPSLTGERWGGKKFAFISISLLTGTKDGRMDRRTGNSSPGPSPPPSPLWFPCHHTHPGPALGERPAKSQLLISKARSNCETHPTPAEQQQHAELRAAAGAPCSPTCSLPFPPPQLPTGCNSVFQCQMHFSPPPLPDCCATDQTKKRKPMLRAGKALAVHSRSQAMSVPKSGDCSTVGSADTQGCPRPRTPQYEIPLRRSL